MRIRCLALLATACTLATLLDQGHAVPTKAAGKGKRQDNIVEKARRLRKLAPCADVGGGELGAVELEPRC